MKSHFVNVAKNEAEDPPILYKELGLHHLCVCWVSTHAEDRCHPSSCSYLQLLVAVEGVEGVEGGGGCPPSLWTSGSDSTDIQQGQVSRTQLLE